MQVELIDAGIRYIYLFERRDASKLSHSMLLLNSGSQVHYAEEGVYKGIHFQKRLKEHPQHNHFN